MKKYDQIHESVLKDVFDLYNDIKGLADGELTDLIGKHKSSRSFSSIARKSNDLVCVFPVLGSKNISISNQAMATKAIEKNCVAMLQMLFSAIQLTDADNAFDYIKTFHTNINKSAKLLDLDDVISIGDAIGITDSAIQVGGKVDRAIVEQVRVDMRNLNFVLGPDVNPKSLAENFTCNLDPDGVYRVQVETRTLMKEDNELSSGVRFDDIVDYNIQTDENLRRMHIGYQREKAGREKAEKEAKEQKSRADKLDTDLAGLTSKYNADIGKKDTKIGDLEGQISKMKDDDSTRRRSKDIADIHKSHIQSKKDAADFFGKQVLNTEYKKANELMPTLMVINFQARTPAGDYHVVDSVVIGVKAKLYPISSEDMVTHLVAKAKDANWIQKLIKASTREISFFKDFLFAIDKAKVDALSLSRKGSANKMWKVLERRAVKSKWNRLMAKSNDATAITTIMLSQNEVDFIKKEYQIDVTDVVNTRILMEKFNLLGIAVIDESLEIAKFMWDTGEDIWETVSFNNLERESNDNTYKKVVNLMTKVM